MRNPAPRGHASRYQPAAWDASRGPHPLSSDSGDAELAVHEPRGASSDYRIIPRAGGMSQAWNRGCYSETGGCIEEQGTVFQARLALIHRRMFVTRGRGVVIQTCFGRGVHLSRRNSGGKRKQEQSHRVSGPCSCRPPGMKRPRTLRDPAAGVEGGGPTMSALGAPWWLLCAGEEQDMEVAARRSSLLLTT